jgi:hypothetical protein
LSDGWDLDLKHTAQVLTSPHDGKPGVSPSAFWKKRYNVSTYAEANETVPDPEFKKAIERRLFIGRRLLSETLGSFR